MIFKILKGIGIQSIQKSVTAKKNSINQSLNISDDTTKIVHEKSAYVFGKSKHGLVIYLSILFAKWGDTVIQGGTGIVLASRILE